MSRQHHTDRATGVLVRYQRQPPGELVHVDVKAGRIPDESAATAALLPIEMASSFADHGLRIQRFLTYNAKVYAESGLFAETAAGLSATAADPRFRRLTNGKVERFHRTPLQEWAYARLHRSNAERRQGFTRWLRFRRTVSMSTCSRMTLLT